MGCIHYDYILLVALLERWDSMDSIFHLPIGEIIITVEDIHLLYYLPIHGHRIQHTINRDGALLAISYLYGVDGVDNIVSKISLGSIRYYQY